MIKWKYPIDGLWKASTPCSIQRQGLFPFYLFNIISLCGFSLIYTRFLPAVKENEENDSSIQAYTAQEEEKETVTNPFRHHMDGPEAPDSTS